MLPNDELEVLARESYTGPVAYRYDGVRVTPLWSIHSKYLEAASSTLRGVLYARTHGCDLLCIHAVGPALFAPLARLLGMKVLFTHHGEDYNRKRWNLVFKVALRLGEWCGVTFADRVIAVSPSLAERMRRRFPKRAARVAYIPNGATRLPSSEPGGAGKLLSSLGVEAGNYIFAAGRLVPEKGFDDLISVVESMAPDKKLVIAGRADHQDRYSQTLLQRASSRVIFAGYQDAASLRVLHENAAVFVLPSYHEGLPITVLEALGAGAAVILSDIPANIDIGLPAHNYFPAGDLAALERKLLDDPATYRVDAEPLLQKFDWEAVARATAALIADLRSSVPQPGPVGHVMEQADELAPRKTVGTSR